MEFILEKGGELEAFDGQGNTALHWAAEKGQAAAIDFLILKGISPNPMNHQCMTPLHTACDLDVADSVDALCKHRPLVDIDCSGELGQTPLHYCAVRDSVNAARKLLEFTPALSRPDQNGVYPIHAAATHASARVMELLFVESERPGSDRSSLLTVTDKEGNSALHSAVNSGDFAAVKLCLKYGARIDIQQADKSTPVHLASSQGALDMVQLMFNSQDENRKSLRLKDVQNQTPLHKAAMFDHAEVVTYLINEGSDYNAKDRQCRTPLLLATARGAWRAVRTLLQRGADFTQTDCDKRNVLHLALLHGGNLDFFGREFFKQKEGALELLNQRDCSGCTPMHYATQQGNIKSVQGLIDLGATVNLKNKEKQSPLHFAARYGRLNSCKRLLDSAIGPHILNESDGAGRTALHIASWSGHVKLVQLLLSKGALLHRDHEGRTPLHLAAVEGYINTMKGLLATHPHLMNQTDDEGNTALHLAARAGQAAVVTFLLDSQAALLRNNSDQSCMEVAIECRNKDVAMAFVMNERWHEAMDDCGERKAPHMLGLIEQLPEVAYTVLERCQTEKKADEEDPRSRRNYDFTYLRCTKDKQSKFLNSEEGFVPLLVLNTMVKFNRINLLSHPVCVNYLAMKWNAYGRACHVTNITIYLVFVFFLTYFVCITDVPDSFRVANRTSFEDSQSVEEYLRLPYADFTMSTIVAVWVICGFASMNILKEIVQLLQQASITGKGRYFYEFTNLLEWTLYATSLAFVAPYLAGENKDFQWQCGAIAVFLAWFNFLLYLQRFDIFGIYVVMFLEILRTLVQVLLVFSILIVAFGLTFHILLPREDNHAHNTPAMSLLRVSTALLLGELDFINSFVDPLNDGDNVTMPYPELTYFFLIGLVLLMPILLMNLLIGLAVGDIASMQHNAHLKRLAMQVELHTDLEQKLPARILKAGERDQYTVYTHTAKYFILRARERGKYFFYIKMLQYFIYRIWNKIRETAGMEGNAIGSKMGGDAANDPQLVILQNEMISQKRRLTLISRRLKEVKEQLDRQYDLLRLIVQKMEIRSEAEDRDEGEGPGGENGRSGQLELDWLAEY
ncbi:transient receptor potential cation channel subfamily A member 1-like isoform X2 [Lytechinus variegatus]|uniref:transient receptor potential cation channel subfamily A member 1-like isoform X2 n=1 Tax=Lytechinus variegatus TaxID=7654 RepID=UPI001BB29825|nr:transient receptor potential cation channel subfamily A member 1-like isoform X2 [Lytechinus variegatus]